MSGSRASGLGLRKESQLNVKVWGVSMGTE